MHANQCLQYSVGSPACFHLFMPNKVCAVQTPLSCGAHCGWPSDITLIRIESLFYSVKAAVVET
ncbi:hypothetical protein I7I53_01241 [Histoplasma capsulatum var. duboisii H88]|uniref:Uncharacterized protein n=1 Tax=Ajellomyces capsulatus (strain H88) TaxID=544711 RepID=A0A8A1LPC1_AJEC8|nr:hypothetical protein I7I53_01241 [Histoplasma capsulatum var. duboisii H88]